MSFAMQNLIRLPSYNVCSLPCRNYDFLSFYFKSNYYRNWSTCIYQNWDIKNKWRKWEINRDIKKMKEKRDWDRINEPQMSFSDQHLSIVWFCPRYFMLKKLLFEFVDSHPNWNESLFIVFAYNYPRQTVYRCFINI